MNADQAASNGKPKHRFRGLVATILAALMFCWPAVLNGGGFYFPDSTTYLRGADAAIVQLTSLRSIWSDKLYLYDRQRDRQVPDGADPGNPAAAPAAIPKEPAHPILLGRSIYYGLAIYLPMVLLGSLGVAAFQAVLASALVRLTLVGIGLNRSRVPIWQVLAGLVLASVTPLPYFVCLLMPDVFVGFAVVCAALLLISSARFSSAERIILVALLIFSVVAHNSHILIILVISGFAAVLRHWFREISRAGVGLLVLAAAAGFAGDHIFATAVADRTGQAPIRPPFLTARLISSGAGYAMLRDECPQVRLAACRYLDRMPQDSDTFLWSVDPANGVFTAVSHEQQRRLAAEDSRFALLTLVRYPGTVIFSSLNGCIEQILSFRLNIFNAPRGEYDGITNNVPVTVKHEITASRYYSRSMPTLASEWATIFSMLLALAYLLSRFFKNFQTRPFSADARRLSLSIGFVVIGVLANAAITGALSKPHDRYNVRIIWVLPLAALANFAHRRRENETEEEDACRSKADRASQS